MKTLAEIYLPEEQKLINKLFRNIQTLIKEKKKIPYLDLDGNPKDEFLEYFIVTDELISFNRRFGNKRKDKVSGKELKDAIKLALRSGEELSRTGFNKMFGKSNFVGTPLYLFINLVEDEIAKRRLIGFELTHQSFGKGLITGIDFQKDMVHFSFGDDRKVISMDYFQVNAEDEREVKNRLINE